jgi:hypothetical protein
MNNENNIDKTIEVVIDQLAGLQHHEVTIVLATLIAALPESQLEGVLKGFESVYRVGQDTPALTVTAEQLSEVVGEGYAVEHDPINNVGYFGKAKEFFFALFVKDGKFSHELTLINEELDAADEDIVNSFKTLQESDIYKAIEEVVTTTNDLLFRKFDWVSMTEDEVKDHVDLVTNRVPAFINEMIAKRDTKIEEDQDAAAEDESPVEDTQA